MYLNCHSYYSYRYGILSPRGLAGLAVAYNVPKLALTDINNVSGAFQFVKACKNKGIEPVIGVEIRTGDVCDYVALAKDLKGFEELNRHLTVQRLAEKALPVPEFAHVFVIFPMENLPFRPLRHFEFVGIRPHERGKLIRSPLRHMTEKLVILHPVTFRDAGGYHLHRILRAVDKNVVLSKLLPHQHGLRNEYFVFEDKLKDCYTGFPEIPSNTEKLLAQCSFHFDFDQRKNKKFFGVSKKDDEAKLRSLTFEGIHKRYGEENPQVVSRVEKELEVINKLSFTFFYLASHDVIRFSMNKGFAHVGRGSCANSIVSYCLGITDVDPIELDLYFERFLNEHRTSPPDFDLDFSWKDRDTVIQYLFDKYGKDRVALLGSYNTFKGRSIIRELGKVFGLPKAEIDRLVENMDRRYAPDEISRTIYYYGQFLQDFPNHLSIHAGGVLISDQPIYAYTATEIPPKGFPVSQFDMYVAEDIKLEKLDILSQRGLGHMKTAVELIRENKGEVIDITDVKRFKQDKKLNDALAVGDTLGCFYIESPAMRQLLCKLYCDNYLTLVAASSIIRPGVAQSGMMREYIKNHHQPDEVKYIHPRFKELLEDTYGVMVYQEDVIKIAHHFGGITMSEADVLRRGMSGKKTSKGQIEKIEEQFFLNCREKGYPDQVTAEVWRQIASFSGYSFSKAHSASFAVESYQSLFLRKYYPLEFMVGVINNFGGFYRTEIYVREAIKLGGAVHPPCINNSTYFTTLYGKDIYLGFIHLKDLEQKLGELIPEERKRNGPYLGLEDFMRRIPIGPEQLTILIRIGAFRFIGKSKKELLWNADLLRVKGKIKAGVVNFFDEPATEWKTPPLAHHAKEDAFDEMDLLGFPLCNPFEIVKHNLQNITTTRQMAHQLDWKVHMLGYLVTIKHVRTSRKETMHFGTFLDHEGNLFDTTHFPPSARNYPFMGKGFYLVYGKIVDDFGVPSLEVDWMKKVPFIEDPRYE